MKNVELDLKEQAQRPQSQCQENRKKSSHDLNSNIGITRPFTVQAQRNTQNNKSAEKTSSQLQIKQPQINAEKKGNPELNEIKVMKDNFIIGNDQSGQKQEVHNQKESKQLESSQSRQRPSSSISNLQQKNDQQKEKQYFPGFQGPLTKAQKMDKFIQ
eukprot:TRINITY_DN13197_c0_g1_i3.p1 TRINITY_DN13197_c0_g1~~TRINITY_DN13197_c0_g1_i3.p1  ORF type:complete len:158 (+),score=39.88 TRINITY_DN13197_c0_g1_i3:432-905(+)